jgi:ABC-type Fe3+-siderophore transport system permease subunit
MARLYRISCAVLLGAQLFFAGAAAQSVFSSEIASLPRDDPRRRAAADAVGNMLARLDAAALVLCAVAVVCALQLQRARAALLPLFAGLCALASAALVTPAIHAMRLAGDTASPGFGTLHGISTSLLVVEMLLLGAAAWFAPESRAT